jgi:hypothetical protein
LFVIFTMNESIKAIILSWVFQILLSEVLGVPTTIEGGSIRRDSRYSFYDEESRFVVPEKAYYNNALVEADDYDGDCSKTVKPCAHMMPTVWSGGKQDIKSSQGEIMLVCSYFIIYLFYSIQ